MNEELSPPALARPAPALMSTCSCPPSRLTFLELLQAESSWPGVPYNLLQLILLCSSFWACGDFSMPCTPL